MSTTSLPQATTEINLFPNLGLNSQKAQILNRYNVRIVAVRVISSLNNFTNVAEPQIQAEIVTLDSGYRIEIVKGKPVTVEGNFPIGQHFLANFPSVANSYYEPKKGSLNKLQQLIFAVTGGTTQSDADRFFLELESQEGWVKGCNIVLEPEIVTSKMGNEYASYKTFYESDGVEVDATIDLEPYLMLELWEKYHEWNLVENPLAITQRSSDIPASQCILLGIFNAETNKRLTAAGFSTKAFNESEELGPDGRPMGEDWIKFLKEEKGRFYKSEKVNGDYVKTDIDGPAAYRLALSLGAVPVTEDVIVDWLNSEDHDEFLRGWIKENVNDTSNVNPFLLSNGRPNSVKKGTPTTLLSSTPATLNPPMISTPKISQAPVAQDNGLNELDDVDFNDIKNPFN